MRWMKLLKNSDEVVIYDFLTCSMPSDECVCVCVFRLLLSLWQERENSSRLMVKNSSLRPSALFYSTTALKTLPTLQ